MMMTVGDDDDDGGDDTNKVAYFQIFRLLWNLMWSRMAN